ncbi:MAG: pentapeptide repeat-containing protein [Pseudomonadales bacterium]|nr:pentapeptide repeat-containing protein [Pseudomonadales bacterium]
MSNNAKPGGATPEIVTPEMEASALLQNTDEVLSQLRAGKDVERGRISGLTLKGADFSKKSIRSSRWNDCDLEGCNFSELDAPLSNFNKMQLAKTCWTQANLEGLTCTQSHAKQSDFSQATLSDTTIRGSSEWLMDAALCDELLSDLDLEDDLLTPVSYTHLTLPTTSRV